MPKFAGLNVEAVWGRGVVACRWDWVATAPRWFNEPRLARKSELPWD